MSGMQTVLMLAQQTEVDKYTITPGVLGFLVVAAIGGVLYFLMRSMKDKLAHVREGGFDQAVEAGPEAPAGTDGGRAEQAPGD